MNSLLLFIPNTFTPNGDFKNDVFNVSVLNYETFDLNIYNTHGTTLFNTTDPAIAWDGKYKGRSVQEGVYTVTIFVVDVFGKVYNINKNLLIIE